MFKKTFKYDNPNKLWKALMDADKKEYNELLHNLKNKQTVLEEQIDIKIGTERRRFESLADTIEDILDSVREDRDLSVSKIPDLESEESAAQRRNQSGRGLKILTPNQMLSRLPISLSQLKVGNNSKYLKTKLGKYCILCTDKKALQNNSIKVWLILFKHGNNFHEQ